MEENQPEIPEPHRMICPECKNAKHFIYTKTAEDGSKMVTITCSNCGLITRVA